MKLNYNCLKYCAVFEICFVLLAFSSLDLVAAISLVISEYLNTSGCDNISTRDLTKSKLSLR